MAGVMNYPHILVKILSYPPFGPMHPPRAVRCPARRVFGINLPQTNPIGPFPIQPTLESISDHLLSGSIDVSEDTE